MFVHPLDISCFVFIAFLLDLEGPYTLLYGICIIQGGQSKLLKMSYADY